MIHAKNECEFEGPFECNSCGGHVMLDGTFLDQVQERVFCPYCGVEQDVPL